MFDCVQVLRAAGKTLRDITAITGVSRPVATDSVRSAAWRIALQSCRRRGHRDISRITWRNDEKPAVSTAASYEALAQIGRLPGV